MARKSDKILTEWLVLNTQSGNSKALNQLLVIWHPKLLRFAARQLNNHEAAKDVVQDTLITIAKQIHKVKDPVAFPKWAYQILHRRGVDYLRKEIRNRRLQNLDSNVEETYESQNQQGKTTDSEIDIKSALSKINETSYLIIHLHYLEGLSIKEIAAIVAIPLGTVKSRLHNARNQLRTILEETL